MFVCAYVHSSACGVRGAGDDEDEDDEDDEDDGDDEDDDEDDDDEDGVVCVGRRPVSLPCFSILPNAFSILASLTSILVGFVVVDVGGDEVVLFPFFLSCSSLSFSFSSRRIRACVVFSCRLRATMVFCCFSIFLSICSIIALVLSFAMCFVSVCSGRVLSVVSIWSWWSSSSFPLVLFGGGVAVGVVLSAVLRVTMRAGVAVGSSRPSPRLPFFFPPFFPFCLTVGDNDLRAGCSALLLAMAFSCLALLLPVATALRFPFPVPCVCLALPTLLFSYVSTRLSCQSPSPVQ